MSNWVVITEKGRVWSYMPTDPNYYKILSAVHSEFCSSGSTWDRPNLLFKDGKLVCEKLYDIAWNYGSSMRAALERATAAVRENFKEPE